MSLSNVGSNLQHIPLMLRIGHLEREVWRTKDLRVAQQIFIGYDTILEFGIGPNSNPESSLWDGGLTALIGDLEIFLTVVFWKSFSKVSNLEIFTVSPTNLYVVAQRIPDRLWYHIKIEFQPNSSSKASLWGEGCPPFTITIHAISLSNVGLQQLFFSTSVY